MIWTESIVSPLATSSGTTGRTLIDHAIELLPTTQPIPRGQTTGIHSLTAVDTSIPDLALVLNDLQSNGRATDAIVLLDRSRDGVQQLTDALQNYTGLHRLEIVSHGDRNHLQLGTASLSTASLDQYRDALQQWRGSMAPGADLLLYGCNVAAGGRELITSLAQITGTDVAASDNYTGSSDLGGDWTLEVQTGSIEATGPLLSPEAQAAFRGQLVGNGLTARYYDNSNFSNLQLTRVDPTVNFNWGSGSPDSRIGNDTFSVVWSGKVQPRFSEEYTFYSTTDDGVRLFVNGQSVINFFQDRAAQTSSGKITLQAGQQYDIRMEYYENAGLASSRLEWSSPNQARQVIPQSQLYSESSSGEPAIALAQDAYSFGEGIGTANLQLNRSGNLSRSSTVQYRLFDDTATGGSDYVRRDGTVTFQAGQSVANIPVQIIDDRVVEPSENFNVTILAPTGATLGTQRTANVVIRDNDAPVGDGNGLRGAYYNNPNFTALALTRVDRTVNFDWGGGSPDGRLASDTFSVRWSGQILPRFSEEYTFYSTTDDGVRLFINGQAVVSAFQDQAATTNTGKIRLEAGQKYDIRLDYYENAGNASSKLEWSSLSQPRQVIPQSQLFTPPVSSGNAGRFQVSDTSLRVDEVTGQATVAVERVGGSSGVATVRYATANGSAQAASDYTARSGTLTFNAGETTKAVVIAINNDTAVERTESLRFNLSNPGGGATLGTDTTTTIAITDNDPGNFSQENFAVGLTQPTAFDWSPDQSIMFVAQKDGVVRAVRNGQLQSTPFVDLQTEVNNVRDRGLLGIAVHPDFTNGSPYIYLAYTYDPPEADRTGRTANTLDDADGRGNRPSRVVRITADASRGYLVAQPGSQVVILGKNSNWANTSRPDGNSTDDLSIAPSGIRNGTNIQDYLATDSESHTIGQLRFGTDKLLYVSNGDGASYNAVDVRATRVQDIDNLSGKLLRIDPITGQGVSSNPFFNGNADSNRSKVYALGFRNPFRFTIDSQTGQPFVGDVGWFSWEEVNAIEAGGNYGWPAYEGGATTSERTTEYEKQPEVTPFYSSIRNLKAPTLGLPHANQGGDARAIVMGDFYRGSTFPAIYRNSLFVNDANTGKLQALFFDGNGRVVDQKNVATLPGAVQLSVGKDSNLYYADLGQGVIGRLRAV